MKNFVGLILFTATMSFTKSIEIVKTGGDIMDINDKENMVSISDEIYFNEKNKIFDELHLIKYRRSIIEEENTGTTVSGFKFTGRDTRLSSDLGYKNINT